MSNLARDLAPEYNAKLEESKRHIFFQHSGADGYITLAKKVNGKFIQHHYKPEQLADQLSNYIGEDVYYSQQTFYKPQRRIENIRQLRSLYVDVDCQNLGYEPDWVVGKLELEQFKQTIPEPNLIIFSGRGLVLIWLIEPVPYQALPLWNSIQKYLLEQLKYVGSDPKALDASRIFRIAGSVNSKNGARVHVQFRHDFRYNLRDIQNEYLPELVPKKEKKKKPGRKKKVVQLFNIYSLNHARILDITKIVELRDYDVDGYREVICFLYRYWMCCFCNDTDEAFRMTKELNNTFTHPLPEKELKSATKSAEKAYQAKSNKEANDIAIKKGYPGAGYNISNAKLIDWLNITSDEMIHLKTIINPAEKRRRELIRKAEQRRESGMRTREKKIEDDKANVMAKVEKLREVLKDNPQLSIRQIVKVSGMPRSTVHRLKKLL